MDMTKDVTAVVINWLTARRTLGAINRFREFYPHVSLIVVDDASAPKDKPEFFHTYGGHDRNPDLEYDPDNEKLREIKGIEYLQAPDFGKHPKSHGYCVDLAIGVIETTWMFHFHSDYRLVKPGILEELVNGVDETYCGAGSNKTRHPRCPALVSVAALYNAEAGREHNVTFRPVIYYNDDTITPFPGPVDGTKKGGIAIEAGSYFVGRLNRLGYKIKWISNLHSRYGVHMRWKGDLGKWNELY